MSFTVLGFIPLLGGSAITTSGLGKSFSFIIGRNDLFKSANTGSKFRILFNETFTTASAIAGSTFSNP